jgi:hypothetical protein
VQKIVDSLRKKGKLFKKMQEVSPKELGIRNKIKIYKATDINGYFWVLFAINQKSRILKKDIEKFEEIAKKFSLYCGHNFKYKAIFIDAPLCSKAKDGFENAGWRVY